MQFKEYEFYQDLYNSVEDIDIVKTNYGKQISFVTDKNVTIADFSFALLLNNIVLKYEIAQENDLNANKFENCYDIYDELCYFFEQDKSKVTLKNLFSAFGLEVDDFDDESIKIFGLAFNNIKNSISYDLVL
ncbi:MAG: hypothetical protein IJZ29_04910 [Clostridia bacterium]|nr:hypothetical protein [Clostridia bacterium]